MSAFEEGRAAYERGGPLPARNPYGADEQCSRFDWRKGFFAALRGDL
jgi:hypothetical protein